MTSGAAGTSALIGCEIKGSNNLLRTGTRLVSVAPRVSMFLPKHFQAAPIRARNGGELVKG